MKILVAGGSGFIGTHLIDFLINAGHSVICVDRQPFNNEGAYKESLFKSIKMDISEQKNVDDVFRENQIDAVYHLAANSDIKSGGQDPIIDFNDTFMTTKCILDAMKRYKVSKLFFASTSAVYGEMNDTLLTESTGGLKPISYYGGAKLASEALICSYAAMNDLNVVIFRFPNVIGPQLTHGVIFDFIAKLKENPNKLEILGDGSQCKPYIHVSDLVNAICHLIDKWAPGVDIYNVSIIGKGTTVAQIAEVLVETIGYRDVEFSYTGGSRGWKGDVPFFEYDISKILATGWKPVYTSYDAVKKTISEVVGQCLR